MFRAPCSSRKSLIFIMLLSSETIYKSGSEGAPVLVLNSLEHYGVDFVLGIRRIPRA
jgi:hypothetical protein